MARREDDAHIECRIEQVAMVQGVGHEPFASTPRAVAAVVDSGGDDDWDATE